MEIEQTVFGTTSDGKTAGLYRMENASGAYVEVTSYGCRIVRICVPDRDGALRDVTLGYDTLAEYEKDGAAFGAVIGRVANRIGRGPFTLGGITYHLIVNNGPNHLHGGLRGFHFYNWGAAIDGNHLRFIRVSPDGEEGYPGTLTMTVEYSWSKDNALRIAYRAKTDRDTIVNPTNHAYFNLSGEDADTVLDHMLMIHADAFTETDENGLVTGRILPVEGTPMDFRAGKPIGRDLPKAFFQPGAEETPVYDQLRYARTYDHNFVLNGPKSPASDESSSREAAILYSPVSGIKMTCTTDQPGAQLYVPADAPAEHGKSGHRYPAYGSVCLETQHFPDAIHHPAFPSIELKPGNPFYSETTYRFSVE